MSANHIGLTLALGLAIGLVGFLALRSSAQVKQFSSPHAFVEYVLKVARKRLPGHAFNQAAGEFSISVDGATANLENLYKTVTSPEWSGKADEEVVRFIGGGIQAQMHETTILSDWQAAKAFLLPLFFPRDYLAQSSHMPVYEDCPFSKQIALGYVLYSKKAILYVSPDQMKKWGVDLPTFKKVSFDNLQRNSGNIRLDVQRAPDGSGSYVAIEGGSFPDFNANQLLVPSVISQLHGALGDPFYMAMPSRTFVICWSHNLSFGPTFPRKVKADYEKNLPHPLTPEIFVVEKDKIALKH